jgi:uncharacterized protein (DUF433 family)
MTDPDANPLFDHLESNPEICGGQVCVKGTRIPISVILDALAGGDTIADVLRGYPTLTEKDVAAALAYGARLARERILPLAKSS